MLDLLPAFIIMVGLVALCYLCLRVFDELDRAADDPVGRVVLTRQERTAIRDLGRRLARTSGKAPRRSLEEPLN